MTGMDWFAVAYVIILSFFLGRASKDFQPKRDSRGRFVKQ